MHSLSKSNLSTEFVRGILFSYVAYDLYGILGVSYSVIVCPESLRWPSVVGTVFVVLIYVAMCYALLFTPKGYSWFVTIVLGILLAFQFVSVFFFAHYWPTRSSFPLSHLVSQLVIGAIMFGLSWTYAYIIKKNNS